MKKISLSIKTIRKERNITQEAFYEDTGIHLARIETGKVNLSISTLAAVCNYFDISLSEFFNLIEEL